MQVFLTLSVTTRTTSPLLLICAVLVLPPRCDTSEGLASIPQKQKQKQFRQSVLHFTPEDDNVIGDLFLASPQVIYEIPW